MIEAAVVEYVMEDEVVVYEKVEVEAAEEDVEEADEVFEIYNKIYMNI